MPRSPLVYPRGSFVSTEKGWFYILNETKRYRITSKRILDSWAPHRVIYTSEAAVSNYRIAAKLKFRNGTLIHNIADGKIYLVESGLRRHITNPDVLDRIGATIKDIVTVSLEEINMHEEGAPLN